MTSEILLRVLMGLGTLGIGWAGWVLNKRAQRDTRDATVAANKLQERVNTVDELNDIIEQWKARVADLTLQLDRLHAQHTEEAERQAARCQAHLDSLIDNVATLQSIVSEEIARSAALDAVRGAQDHEATDHDRTWRPDETRY